MRRLSRLLILPSLVMAGLCAGANITGLPPLEGDLSGKIELRALAGAPPVTWRLQAHPAADETMQVEVTLTAPGLGALLRVALPADGAPGTWEVIQGSVDLAAWWRAATAAAHTTLSPDLEVAGVLQFSGSGTVEDLKPTGRITATLQGGRLQSVEQGWDASALVLNSVLTLGAEGVVLQSAQLRVGVAAAGGIVAHNLTVDAVGAPEGRIEVRRVEVEVLGGRVRLAPFTTDPAALDVRTSAELTGVALSELATLLPDTLAEAHGRLNGQVALRWSAKDGFKPGAGSLTVLPDTPASLRLAPAPGFLTQHMPERIQLLPEWLGPLARWFAPENPAYDNLRQIELGQQALTVEKLRVELYPDGTGATRSATVEVAARPPAGSVVKQVTFTINVSGPLEQVLKLGLDDRAKVKISPMK